MKHFVKTGLIILISLPIFLLVAQAQTVKISPLVINSADDDFGTAFSGDKNMMLFTSARAADGFGKSVEQKVFTSISWTKPEALNDAINNGQQNGSVTITPDGQYMVFAAYEHDEDGEGRTDLYGVRKVRGEWKDVVNLGPTVNSNAWDSQPWISGDGQILYFASDRPGGRGGADIYYCERRGDGWSQARNAGTRINSDADDMCPVLAPDGTTFYFASNRSSSIGGFDIWSSKRDAGDFGPLFHLKAPINTEHDEYFFTAMVNSDIAYFSSNRPEDNRGGLDIYTALPNPVIPEPVRIVQGKVTDAQTGRPVQADLIITDLQTGAFIGELRSDDVTGDYTVWLPVGMRYSITASHPDYLFYSERFDVLPGDEGSEVRHDIKLSRTQTRLLVFFDFDSSKLTGDSQSELRRLVDFMNSHSKSIELIGHTDDVGDDAYNDKLSQRRAEAVKSFLLENGINDSRIKTTGKGKREPIDKGTTDEARARNRRVEMHVI